MTSVRHCARLTKLTGGQSALTVDRTCWSWSSRLTSVVVVFDVLRGRQGLSAAAMSPRPATPLSTPGRVVAVPVHHVAGALLRRRSLVCHRVDVGVVAERRRD